MAEWDYFSAPRSPAELHEAALRFAAELDLAGLYRAAAYAGLLAEATSEAPRRPEDEDLRTDVDLDFALDEHGRVWIILEGDCHIIGRRNAVCAEMRRFLVCVELGGGGIGGGDV